MLILLSLVVISILLVQARLIRGQKKELKGYEDITVELLTEINNLNEQADRVSSLDCNEKLKSDYVRAVRDLEKFKKLYDNVLLRYNQEVGFKTV